MNNFIEMFSGIGGMGYGLMQAGWNCVGYAEIDKYAHQAYEILHDPEKRMWNAYDVKSVTDDDLRLLGRERGPIQLLAGGFPCQSFSIAGKRQGFTDATRGTLFFEIIRWASILRPEYLLLENVTGLLNHDEGRTFQTVIGSLDELGYVGEWCVLNSAAYVPQNRERIFIVASLRGSSRPKIFPFGSENENAIEVIGKLEGNHDQNSRVYGIDGIAPTLGTMQGGGQEPKVLVNVGDGKLQIRKHNISNCLDANYFKGLDNHQGRTGVLEPVAVLTPDREEKRQNGRRFKEPGEPMFTLTAQDKHGVAILRQARTEYGKQVRKEYEAGEIDEGRQSMVALEPRTDGMANTLTTVQKDNLLLTGYRIRKLTPLECFRLQSYPDWWYYKLKENGISDSQLYRMAGNGVTSIVAYEIGKRLTEGHQPSAQA